MNNITNIQVVIGIALVVIIAYLFYQRRNIDESYRTTGSNRPMCLYKCGMDFFHPINQYCKNLYKDQNDIGNCETELNTIAYSTITHNTCNQQCQ